MCQQLVRTCSPINCVRWAVVPYNWPLNFDFYGFLCTGCVCWTWYVICRCMDCVCVHTMLLMIYLGVSVFSSGADLTALVREAAVLALREHMQLTSPFQSNQSDYLITAESCVVFRRHFTTALTKVKPSVSQKVSSRPFTSLPEVFLYLCTMVPCL